MHFSGTFIKRFNYMFFGKDLIFRAEKFIYIYYFISTNQLENYIFLEHYYLTLINCIKYNDIHGFTHRNNYLAYSAYIWYTYMFP